MAPGGVTEIELATLRRSQNRDGRCCRRRRHCEGHDPGSDSAADAVRVAIGLFLFVLALLALFKPPVMKLFFEKRVPRLAIRERMAGFARTLVGAVCGAAPAWLIFVAGKAWLGPVVGLTVADWVTGALGIIVLVVGYVLGVELADRRSKSARA